jgi:biopolymer transport protein ExbD
MRLSKHKRNMMAAMNMTPMIDITFLLIIFFMTVSQVTKVNKEPVELPKQKGSDDQKPAVLTLNVDQDGQIIVSGNTYTVAELVSIVSDELASVGNDPNRLTILLRGDRRGTSRTANRVAGALGNLGVNQIRIAVEASEG